MSIESLLARGYDEPFTLYALLARSVETDAARSWVSFEIDPAARFSDGTPVTPDDVIFSWGLLRDHGRPLYRTYYIKVKSAEAFRERGVRFDLSGANDRELPLILGLMPVLARHAVRLDTFENTTFEAPLGSGPYTVTAVKPGQSVTFTRNAQYWGHDLPINRGLWNFGEIRFDYYRDGNTHFEAFKKGLYDARLELDPSSWQTAYDFPAARDRRVVKEAFPYGLPKGMQGLVMNTRRHAFADIRVREALNFLFDFEWLNHNYFFDLYKRTASYFDGCDLSAHGVAGERARARTARAPSPMPCAPTSWTAPGNRRRATARAATARCCITALALFEQAGYALKGTALTHRASGRPFAFRNSDQHPRAGARGARLCRASQARRHRRARAQWSTPRSSRRAASPSTST